MKPQVALLAIGLLCLSSCSDARGQSAAAETARFGGGPTRAEDSAAPAASMTPAPDAMPPGFDPARHMRLSEVKEGMTGYGLSVFKGTKIERFDVRVVSILRNFNPKFDVVLIECHGCNLEHTGPIAGMSGSPIFLKDDQGRERMIGAFAYGWPMQKDPLAGVQPIEYMLKIPVTQIGLDEIEGKSPADNLPAGAVPAAQPRSTWNLRDLRLPAVHSGSTASVLLASPRLSVDADDTMHMRPLATPLMVSGLSPQAISELGPAFSQSGLILLQAGGADASPTTAPAKLEPGSVLAVPLLTGDADFTAVGTCTEVIGDRVLGFGHPFNNEGAIALPMGGGEVNAIIANLNTSFKLGAMTKVQGALLADQSVGVAGKTGIIAPTVPIQIRVVYDDGTSDQTFHFQGALHPRLTPQIAGAALAAAISGNHDLPQYHTLNYDLSLKFANGKTVQVQNTSVNADAGELTGEIALPIMAASENPYERVLLKEMTGTIHVSREAREATILSVSVPKLKYRPGETAKVFVTYRPFRGSESILPIEFELPHDINDGIYHFTVNDWQTYLQNELAAKPFRFTAQTGDEVFAVLDDAMSIRHDALYLQLLREPDGIALGRTALPHLPSSRRQVLMEAGLSSTTPFMTTTTKIVPTEMVIDGSAAFDITIDKEAKVESPAAGKAPPAKPEPHAPAAAPKTDEPKGKPSASPEPSN